MNTNPNHSQETIDLVWRGFLAILIALTVMYLPLDALANTGGNTGLSKALCNVVSWITGPIGKGIATLALIIVGIGALMGKISWGMAIIVGLGVGIMFGATTLVDALGGNGSQNCTLGSYTNTIG